MILVTAMPAIAAMPDVAALGESPPDIVRSCEPVAVTDNGLGIAPDQHERIFEVFTRLMGSEVLVESTVGAGSTISLELPAAGEYADV